MGHRRSYIISWKAQPSTQRSIENPRGTSVAMPCTMLEAQCWKSSEPWSRFLELR